MKSLIRFSMKNTLAVFILIFLLVGGGLFSVSQMKMEKYPDVDIPYFHVNIIYPGASPEQSMRDIGEPLEKEFANIEGAVSVYSWANPNNFHGMIKADMSADMDALEEEVRNIVAKANLPETIKEPHFFRESLDDVIYMISFSGADQSKVQRFVQDEAEPAIRSVKGIDQVTVRGEQKKNVYISVRPDDLKKKGLTLDQVQQMITANHVSIPIGDIRTPKDVLPIRLDEQMASLEDVRNIQLTAVPTPESLQEAGGMLETFRLSDIADISFEAKSHSISRMNGEPAVTVSVTAKGGEDVVGIVKDVKKEMDELTLPTGINQELLIDQSGEIEKSVNGMLREVLLGALMAAIVTLLFLRNIQSTIIAVISIPLSMCASFIVLNYFGYSLNMMTLAGIAVAVGRVIDDSIVVIENVFRRVRISKNRSPELVEDSTREVAVAITSSTMTTVAVFLPLAFVPGIVGKFFVPLAWTVVVSLLFSLLVAITAVPLLSRLFLLKLEHTEHKENGIQRLYRRVLDWVLDHRLITLALSIVLLAGSAAIPAMGWIGFNFLPNEKATSFNIEIDMPIGSNIQKTERVVKQVEETLEGHPDVIQIYTTAGDEHGQITYQVKKETDVDNLGDELRSDFANIKDAESIVLVGIGGMRVDSHFRIIINGPNSEAISKASEQILQALKKVDGLADVRSSSEGQKPEVNIDFNHGALAENGLTPAGVAMSLRTMIEGSTITSIDIEKKPADVILQLHSDNMSNVSKFEEQEITNQLGQPIKLKELGNIKQTLGAIDISRLDQKEYLQVYGTITDENQSRVTNDAFAAIDELDLPRGITLTSEGAAKEMREGFINMGIALAVSVILVYFVMLLAFGEAVMPFVILAAIPFSIIGAIGGLFALGEPIGMPAMIGLLMLNGIVVTNAIVLLDRVKRNEKAGMNRRQALMEGGVTRVRPILMTAIATMVALLPLAISSEAGVVSRALAIVVIGGLASSTFLTLFIVPAIYSLVKPFRKESVADFSHNKKEGIL
ncbi:efflux RND transporter permease subunit [Siminovitchia acidinfaciens]|uniref:Efflux RND transporter permease subunit n=1 Tax=Siminovitchia acidinfaciens TaxID=2321395 RepID=A0A429Y6V6_9BACI|nr:efflux RND transporter permease subunit [Siminovitchia acidinfaciens]RST77156.1 efflux RND transporter permease subunit [Siminovitchia acidinfaciens]